MPPPFDHAFAGDLPAPYDRVYSEAATFVPASRLITDPLRLLTWGSDASFYRLVPKIIVVIESEDELRASARALRALADAGHVPCGGHEPVGTGDQRFGAGDARRQLARLHAAARAAKRSRCSPASSAPWPIGASRRFGRKIGPDPASIDTAMIGGIAANNASGMCCGTAQNSYQTLAGLRVVLADGTVLDTRDAASRAAFARAATRAGARVSLRWAKPYAPTKRWPRASAASSR